MVTTITAFFLPLLLLLLSAAAQPQSPSPSGFITSSDVPVASAPGPSGAVDCTIYLVNLADCLTYVEPGSNLTVPEKPCCGELSDLVNRQPVCLCEFLNNSTKAVGIEIDVHRALGLQKVCKIDGPSVSLCSVAGYPVAGVPTSSPMAPGMAPGGGGGSSDVETGMPPGIAPSSVSEKGRNGASGIKVSPSIYFLVCITMALIFFSS